LSLVVALQSVGAPGEEVAVAQVVEGDTFKDHGRVCRNFRFYWTTDLPPQRQLSIVRLDRLSIGELHNLRMLVAWQTRNHRAYLTRFLVLLAPGERLG